MVAPWKWVARIIYEYLSPSLACAFTESKGPDRSRQQHQPSSAKEAYELPPHPSPVYPYSSSAAVAVILTVSALFVLKNHFSGSSRKYRGISFGS